MDDEIVKRWCGFCEGDLNLDTSSFLTMFQDAKNDVELEEIFKFFPHSSELINRVKNVQFAVINRKGLVRSEPEKCLELADRDLSERLKASDALGDKELVNIARRAPRRFVSDFSLVRKLQGDDWNVGLIENTNDYVNSTMISKEPHYFAIFEAFYGMTTLFPIKWYLCEPLIENSVDFSNYFKMWELRGDYVLTEVDVLTSQDLD